MKFAIHILVFVAFIAINPMSVHAAEGRMACSLSASVLKTEIQKNGPKAVRRAQAEHWDSLMTCIAMGTSDWLHIASSLHGATDASFSEELDAAVGEALGNQPKNVLIMLKQEPIDGFTLEAICAAPDSDDERFNSYELATREIIRREKAILGVTGEDLLDSIATCHTYLEQAKKWVAYTYGVGPDPD